MMIPAEMTKGLNPAVAHELEAFVVLCRNVAELVKKENNLLLTSGTLVAGSDFFLKLELIEKFETQVKYVADVIKEQAPENEWLRMYLVSEINVLRHAFKLNTALHVEDIKRRAVRIENIKKGIIAKGPGAKAEEATCH